MWNLMKFDDILVGWFPGEENQLHCIMLAGHSAYDIQVMADVGNLLAYIYQMGS